MSYDPSHRRPPRQERWPQATPPGGWPSYRDGEQPGYQHASGGGHAGYRSAVATDPFAPAASGYPGTGSDYRTGGYPGARHAGGVDRSAATGGYPAVRYGIATEQLPAGYGRATDEFAGGYARDADGYGSADGYARDANGYGSADGDFTGPDGYPGPGSYDEPAFPGPALTAPDAGVRPDRWQADQDDRREAARRGLAVSAVTGFLAVAAAIGVSTLAAAVLRGQVVPVSAVGGVFVDRTPAALRALVLRHFGGHGRDALLLGMYGAIALLAIAAGVLTRRAAALGATAIVAFTLITAFVTVTRPGSAAADVIPAAAGGLAGLAALAWLVRAATPQAPLRHARGGGRRRTR